MYPNLTPFLVGLGGAGLLVTVVLALRGPLTRRLALRQVNRRRAEAALVVAGSVLGTAIIVGSLVVGDTLDHSFKQDAYRTLGVVDEVVSSPDPAQGAEAARRLEPLRGDPAVDGLLTVRRHGGPPVTGRPARKGEPAGHRAGAGLRGGGPASRGRGRPWPGRPPAPAGWCSTTPWPAPSTPAPATASPSTCTAARSSWRWPGSCRPAGWPASAGRGAFVEPAPAVDRRGGRRPRRPRDPHPGLQRRRGRGRGRRHRPGQGQAPGRPRAPGPPGHRGRHPQAGAPGPGRVHRGRVRRRCSCSSAASPSSPASCCW